jgi:hypothetical protein
MACTVVELNLVAGVDYDLDLAAGRIRFRSDGQLGALIDAGNFCGLVVNACCQDASCDPYGPYACDLTCYVRDGYDTVMQEGAENYRTDDEKMIKMVGVEAEPLPSSSPLDLQVDVGFAPTPNCFTWKETRDLPFECQTAKSAAQHIADRTRPDGTFYYPTWRRGIYLSTRFRISGVGGAGQFSALSKMIKGWGQQDSP